MGGSFTNISGSARVNLAEFDLNDGTLTSFDAGLNRSLVQALAVSGDTLYAGGIFRTAGGLPHRAFAAFDLNTGSVSSWDPGFSGSVCSLTVQGTRLFACGNFTKVGGLYRTNYAGIDTASGELLPAADTDGFVYSAVATSNLVILAGSFSTISGQKRTNLAVIDPATGEVGNWSPGCDLFARTVQIIDGTLYVEGAFLKCGGVGTRGIAAFPMASPGTPSITITPGSFVVLSDGTVQFRLSASGLLQATVQASTDLAHWQDVQSVSWSAAAAFSAKTLANPYGFTELRCHKRALYVALHSGFEFQGFGVQGCYEQFGIRAATNSAMARQEALSVIPTTQEVKDQRKSENVRFGDQFCQPWSWRTAS